MRSFYKHRMEIYIALGSNLGNRAANLAEAMNALRAVGAVCAQSQVYETAPLYLTEQPAYLNAVVKLETSLTAEQVLTALQEIENTAGRERGVRYGARILDLDILYYGNAVIETATLQVPHLLLAERAFVLYPLCDVAPNLKHPVTGKASTEMKTAVCGQDVKVYSKLITD
jgi:2-amino-4-hydroxy-6-hydroxymethyldihydropteridine diphosphokinase